MSMLFDTPGLSIATSSTATSSASAPSPYEKRRKGASGPKPKSAEAPINLEKLMKTMRKDSGWGKELGGGGKSGVEQTEKDEATRLRRAEARKVRTQNKRSKGDNPEKSETGKVVTGKVKQRFDPSVNSAKHKKEKKLFKAAASALAAEEASGFSPASSSNYIPIPNHSSTVDVTPSSPPPTKSTKAFVAPNHSPSASTSTAPPQTAMQISLRAKLAGGRFRMLNETLYTSTGEEAGETMREEGAFDDYHAGFRSQSAHWPVHPLALLNTALEKLPERSLIADFGCGDAALARSLVPKNIKVLSYDLVSKDGWVVECGCASVPLPGGGAGGEIVDVVVCCLSLMGTDWVEIVREARRVLKDGGELKIAEVTSRFTNLDSFIALINSLGFKLLRKDTTNTHFVTIDFSKIANGEERDQIAGHTKKALELLKPCIYKKR